VSVCRGWRESFETFLADMGPKPSPRHSIDRFPDGNGNYEPGNCRWATPAEQVRSRSTSPGVTFRGRTMFWREWAEEIGVSYNSLLARRKRGWSLERMLTTPRAEKHCSAKRRKSHG